MLYFRHMRGGPSISGRSVNTRGALRNLLATSREGGFTVIEVIIVLAISGALFVSAAIMISGRQNQTAFDQAVQQVHSQIQQALNEVSTGYYPNNTDFQCTALINGSPPTLSAGNTGQGANSGCIFLGKAIQFTVENHDPEQFAIYTITGRQKVSTGGAESGSLAEAMPIVVAPSNTTQESSGYPNNTVTEELRSGLRVVRMWYNDGGPDVDIGGIAFVKSLAAFGTSGQVVSGAGSVDVIALDGTIRHDTKLAMALKMNSGTGGRIANGNVNPVNGIFVCFESGGTEDYGIVRIGGGNRELSVDLVTVDKGATGCVYPES